MTERVFMMIDSVNAVREAGQLMNRGARQVARDEVLEGYMNMNKAVRQTQANIAVIRAEDTMVGALLDIYG